ncbi:MAG: guanylate kinase [Bacilli bacterium]
MLVLIGPSASGKTEIAKILIEKYNFEKLVTYTTRKKRVNEKCGIDYHFVSKEEFLLMKDKNEFIETTFYNDNYYGTRIKDISDNKVVILDPAGANNFLNYFKDRIYTVYLETTKELRKKRMLERHDELDLIHKRLENDDKIFNKENIKKINKVIINEQTTLEILAHEIYNLYINRK